jgi:hypothetical protein
VGREGVQGMQRDSSGIGGERTRVRCYGICGKPGHNARTCQEVVESSDLAISDIIVVSS